MIDLYKIFWPNPPSSALTCLKQIYSGALTYLIFLGRTEARLKLLFSLLKEIYEHLSCKYR